MPTVLIITRYFPPLGPAGASIRLVKLLKHASRFGWDFVVLTQDLRRTVVPEHHHSAFLLDELPVGVQIHRVTAPCSVSDPRPHSGMGAVVRKLCRKVLGDSSFAWGLMVFRYGLARRNSIRPELILVETPPFTTALIAMLFGWVWQLPFVLDLKDDWVGSSTFGARLILRQKLEIALERLIVRESSAVIVVTPESHRLYTDRYAYLNHPGKFHLLPNGCDIEEYEVLGSRERKIVSGRFLILSAASGYRKGYRDITPLLLALADFLKRRSDARNKIEVVLLGDSLSDEYRDQIESLGLCGTIQVVKAARRDEFVEWLWKADLLFLIQPRHNTTSISGTLYEYWATGKAPVLLISEQGASSRLVSSNRIGRHFLFSETSQIARYIEEMFDAYRHGSPVWIERSGIEEYDRRQLARRMNDIWMTIIRKS